MTVAVSRMVNDRSGATIMEFALVAPVLMLMLMGFFDLGHREYVGVVLQGAIEDAGRASTLQTGVINPTDIDARVQKIVRLTIGANTTFLPPSRKSYTNFADIGTPEYFVDKSPYNGKYDPGECFDDVNGNNTWDADRGRIGSGGAQDIVVYSMTVTFPRLFPIAKFMGWTNEQSVTASTVLRNQPYAQQANATVRVCP